MVIPTWTGDELSAGPVYEVRRPNFHGIISGLEGLIAGIKSEECKINR